MPGENKCPDVPLPLSILFEHVVGQHLLQIEAGQKCPAAALRRCKTVGQLQLVLQILSLWRGQFSAGRHLILVRWVDERKRHGGSGLQHQQRGAEPDRRDRACAGEPTDWPTWFRADRSIWATLSSRPLRLVPDHLRCRIVPRSCIVVSRTADQDE